nr:cytochrome P450 6a2-like [Halyomorpha halys]
MLTVLIGLLIPLWLFYKFYVSIYNYWESRGIAAEPGRFPFGNNLRFITMKDSSTPLINKMYKKHESQPYFGFYMLRSPLLVVKDPEIIRLVLAKDFNHFRNRFPESALSSKEDKLQHHLFNLGGEKWRPLRIKLTPTFTSGKLKAMFPLFIACAEDLSNMLLGQIDKPVNVKDITACYTTDTVCSCVFGWENNSINEKENEMRKLGQKIMLIPKLVIIKRFVRNIFPSIARLLQFRTVRREIEDSLIKIVGDTIAYREANEVKRNDFLGLLIQLKNKGSVEDDVKKNGIDTDVEPVEMNLGMLTAQCFVFFLAGFETSSSVQSYCLYELALNPDVQRKLREEIHSTISKHGGITYQAIKEMEYLDMVVSETMRMYPTVPTLNRSCTKDYTTPAGHKIKKGDEIINPIWSLQRDSKYFPDPKKFDPERFSPKNKDKIKPFTYMPFGDGPRNCIGSRFGLIQTKVGIITILKNYEVHKTEETQIPLKFRGSAIIAMTKGPITLKFSPKPFAL